MARGRLAVGLDGGGQVEEPAPPDDDEDALAPPGAEAFVAEADAEFFDRTYLARSEDWGIAEPTPSPAPFPLQVIPRVAFVINYNMVRDPDTGEWTPQNPFDGGGSGMTLVDSGTVTVADTASATVETSLTDFSRRLWPWVRFTSDPGTFVAFQGDANAFANEIGFQLFWDPSNTPSSWEIQILNESGASQDLEWLVYELPE